MSLQKTALGLVERVGNLERGSRSGRISRGVKRKRVNRLRRRAATAERLEQRELLAGDINYAFGTEMREYRLALATTAEFTSAVGGVGATQTLLSNVVSDLNNLFNQDLAINLQLVNDVSLISTNAVGDGLTDGDVGALLNEGTSHIDGAIGNSNYDVGHVLGTFSSGGASGISGLGIIGWDSIKGRGATVGGTSFIGSAG